MQNGDISLVIEDISGVSINTEIISRTTNNFIYPSGTFSVGQIYPRSFQVINRKKKKHSSARSIVKKFKSHSGAVIERISKDTEQEKPKDPKEIALELSQYFHNVNPYYTSIRIDHIVLTKYKFVFSFKKKPRLGHINIIIPLDNNNPETIIAYTKIRYTSATLFEWQVKLGELDTQGTLFNFSTKKHFGKNSSKFKSTCKVLLNSDIYEEADRIFHDNQWVRWQFKRIVLIWLNKKSKCRIIGEDCDIYTCDPIPLNEQIRIMSISNRTEYVFSGNVLLKTVKSCLEGQIMSIPDVKTPRNPFTNTPFSYGEMIEVYNGILRWCAKKGKPLPGIIGLYREHRFRPNLVLRIHNNYVQMNATHNYILNDDTTGDFFIETIQILFEDFDDLLIKEFDPAIIGYQRFRLWNKMDPKHYLLICWKKLAADFWYYKQTEQFPRENWKKELHIFFDTATLLRVSNDILTYITNEYYRLLISD